MANNSLIVANLYDCGSCSGDIDVYCYSNSTLSNVGHVINRYGKKLKNNTTINSVSAFRFRVNPSGILIKISNESDSHPYYYGIYTCELPESEGNTLEASIGIYESLPCMTEVLSLRL